MSTCNGRLVRFVTSPGGRYNESTPGADAGDAGEWPKPPCSTGFAHRYGSLVSTGSKVVVWGGWNGSLDNNTSNLVTTYTNGGLAIDPGTCNKVALSTTQAPSKRAHHSAVWTGSKMIVFGGAMGNTTYSDGGIYDPVADAWAPLSVGDPESRKDHYAVWTGDEMLVWGGAGLFSKKAGCIYKP